MKCLVLKKGHNHLIRIILFAEIILGLISFPLVQNQLQASSAGKKEIPRITFKNLSPPYKDYDYFQGVYTFGSPRVGNEAFKDNFDVKSKAGRPIVYELPACFKNDLIRSPSATAMFTVTSSIVQNPRYQIISLAF